MFNYCPNCGAEKPEIIRGMKILCATCGFQFYQSTAAAVAVLISCGDRYILLKRGRDPGKGLLDLPGGFVDPDESAEEACRREIREEIGAEIHDLRYLTSHGNTYPYKGITYKTCDLLFTATCRKEEFSLQEEEIGGILLVPKDEIPLDKFAFFSQKIMLKQVIFELDN